MSVHDLIARLQGKKRAYDTTEEVVELLDEQAARVHDERLPAHLRGVTAITERLGYQPGLLALRGETYDSALYLEALVTNARSQGLDDLAEDLAELAELMHEATGKLARAVHATIPAPEIPLTRAA
ncbi:hypothetical protein [Streptomyces sp. NPDC047968]|uniref:hypothetical protein n=1 Tax=Streptomyces TaxID=1883 RepID=UPI00341E1F6D